MGSYIHTFRRSPRFQSIPLCSARSDRPRWSFGRVGRMSTPFYCTCCARCTDTLQEKEGRRCTFIYSLREESVSYDEERDKSEKVWQENKTALFFLSCTRAKNSNADWTRATEGRFN